VVLQQSGPWTVGMLANHIWAAGGDDSRSNVSATSLQPFLTYTTRTHTTFSTNTESTYDWKNEQWQVPLNFAVAQFQGRHPNAPGADGGKVLGQGARRWPQGLGLEDAVDAAVPQMRRGEARLKASPHQPRAGHRSLASRGLRP
jgi:hypothetical protein